MPAHDEELFDTLSESSPTIRTSLPLSSPVSMTAPLRILPRIPASNWIRVLDSAPDEVLLICCSNKVAAIDAALRKRDSGM
jgi:hypothetical protein